MPSSARLGACLIPFPLRQFSKELRGIGLGAFPAYDANHQRIELAAGILHLDPIEVQEYQRTGQSSSFVSIYERVILADVEGICCRLIEQSLM